MKVEKIFRLKAQKARIKANTYLLIQPLDTNLKHQLLAQLIDCKLVGTKCYDGQFNEQKTKNSRYPHVKLNIALGKFKHDTCYKYLGSYGFYPLT